MSSQKVRILIVDDHPLVRDGLNARLSTVPSFEVVGEADDADAALKLLGEVQCDLVLTDVGMKRVNGIMLTRSIVEQFPHIAVVVLSVYDEPEYVHQAMLAGARGYVLKDGPSVQIINAIETVSNGGTYLSPAIANCLFGPQSVEKTLSSREQQILSCLSQGLSSKQMAKMLSISVRTVESHRQSIKRKFFLGGQAELIKFAVERVRR